MHQPVADDDPPVNRSVCLALEPGYSYFPARCVRDWMHDGPHGCRTNITMGMYATIPDWAKDVHEWAA